MRGLPAALRFLTRIPIPHAAGAERDDLAAARPWFPLAGLVIGVALAATHYAARGQDAWIAALAVLLVWVWITGALHLDGLGDVADALGAAHGDRERFYRVLADPHAGSFAVTAIALQIAAKLVLLAHQPVAAPVWPLLLVPAWARWGVLVWSGTLRALKPGLGAAISAEPSWIATIVWALILGIATAATAPALLAVMLIVPALAVYWRWRLGGMTGDCLGAGVEVTETLLLAAVVLLPSHT
jgi:adenosylcobinamide-GDP ribazoletransferase